MRLTITSADYAKLWEIVGGRSSHSFEDLAQADAVLAKLEEIGEPNVQTDEEGNPTGITEGYVLADDSAELEIDDDQVTFLRRRLDQELRRGTTLERRDLLPLARPLEAAAAAAEEARRQAEADGRAAEVDQELAAARAELDTVQQELGTARTHLDGVRAEIDIQERRRDLAVLEAQQAQAELEGGAR